MWDFIHLQPPHPQQQTLMSLQTYCRVIPIRPLFLFVHVSDTVLGTAVSKAEFLSYRARVLVGKGQRSTQKLVR